VAAPDSVFADLAAEATELDQLVAGIEPARWQAATPSPGWTIAHQIGHLAEGDRLAVLALTDPVAFEAHRSELIAAAGDGTGEAAAAGDGAPEGAAAGDGTGEAAAAGDGTAGGGAAEGAVAGDSAAGSATAGFGAAADSAAADAAVLPPGELLTDWRESRTALLAALADAPAGERVPWLVTPVAPATLATTRLMELIGHGQDIRDALEVPWTPTDRIRHLARLGVRTRDFAYAARGLPPPAGEFRVELTSPGGELWEFGPPDAPQRVTGPAADFCLLVTRRRHRADLRLQAEGGDADGWLDFAQAYAGPPSPGRQPGQFPALPQ